MAQLPLTAGRNTLLDISRAMGPDGKVAKVAELLNQSNELLNYLPFFEGNLPTGHKASVRTGLPEPTLRSFYSGVKVTKSGRSTVQDVCAMAAARSEVDVALANLGGNRDAFRMSEALAHIEGMNQVFAKQLMYGDTAVNPDGMLGLTPRYNSLSSTAGENILNAGGTGSDNTSVWLLVLGENTIHGIYPKGSKAGLQQQDLGEIDARDENGDPYRVYAELFDWHFGLHVRDWRCAVRIGNIDVSDLLAQTGTQANTASTWLHKLMISALAQIPSMGMGVPVFLANRTVKKMLSIGAMDKSQNVLAFGAGVDQFGAVGPGSVAGQGTGISGGRLLFQGVPVLTMDKILSTEAPVGA